VGSASRPMVINKKVHLYRWGYIYKPNESKRKLAEAVRVHLANIPKYTCQMQHPSLPDASDIRQNIGVVNLPPGGASWKAAVPIRPKHIRYLFSRNAMGQWVWVSAAGRCRWLVTHRNEQNNDLIATQIILALKCYKLKTGSLPRTLDELVPEYFPNVPLDQMDGKPFRYLPDRKIIYSVGLDIVDDGGKECDHNTGKGDTIWEIKF